MTASLRSRALRTAARLVAPFQLARHPFVRNVYRRAYRLFVPEGQTQVQVGPVRMFVDPHDSGVGYQLNIGRPYEPVSTTLFERELKPGMVVLDLGANIGYYGLLAAHLVGKEGSVWAFEPEPENHALLCRSSEANGFAQLHAFQLACSDRNESVTLRLAEVGKGLHTIGQAAAGWGGIEVQAVRLDDFLGERDVHPDFIKMDIEGVEPRAVAGMAGLLRAHPACRLLTELHPMALGRNGTKVEDFLDQLGELGLSILSVVDEVEGRELHVDRAQLLELCRLRPTEVKDWSCNVLFGRA